MLDGGVGGIVILATIAVVTDGSTFLELSFLEEPRDSVVTRGSSALLNCNVHSNLPVELQWLKDGITLQNDSRRYKLSNGSLYFGHVEHTVSHRPDQGMYQCRASVRQHGTIVSRKAHVQVSYLRAIGSESRLLPLHVGDVAMLQCLVDGLPRPSIVWYRDDRLLSLSKGSSSSYHVHIDSRILEIQGLKSTDFGQYKCKAQGALEEQLGQVVAKISQHYNQSAYHGVTPQFVMTPHDQNAVEGDSVVLYCGANGRDRNGKQPQITWLKDGSTLDLSTMDRRLYLEGQGSLHIGRLEANDSGFYTCRATNMEDSVDADAVLRVLVPPRFLRRPANLEAQLNSDVELECDVYGKPSASVEWLKNGDIVIPSDYFQIIDGKNLKILGLVASDEGMYQCMASNSVGTAQASAQLLIKKEVSKDNTTPSSPLKSGSSQSVARKGSIPAPSNLTAIVLSSSYISLAWKPPQLLKESLEILGYLITWKEEGSMRERVMNTTASEADLHLLKPSTKYVFRVAAFSSQGVSPNAAIVEAEMHAEEMVPGQPLNLEVTVLSSTSVKLTWESPLQPSSAEPITHYKLYYGVVGDTSGESDVNVIETQYAVTGLLKFYEYSFRVVAYNRNGPGASSARVVCHTYSDVPSSSPQNVTVEAASSTSILVGWEPPPDGSQNGVITGYKIQYKQRREKTGIMITTDGTRRVYSISGLEKGIEYSVAIQAQTVNGSGPATQWMTTRTFAHDLDESTVPGKPTSLQVRPVTNTVLVSWTPPVEQDILIRGYILGYGAGIPDIYRQVLDARLRHYTIRGLRPSVQYVISLKAFNNIGEGVPIYDTVATREETTMEPLTPMMPPVGLKTIVRSSTAMTLLWTDTTLGRSQRVTDNRFYTVRYNQKFIRKYKLVNCSELILNVDDLQPDQEYEFSVKVSKGMRQSTWSLSVFNKTREAAPSSAPRDLTVVAVRDSTAVILSWYPPRQPNGQLTGYLVHYSTDPAINDIDWVVEGVIGEHLTTTIRSLRPETTYYFKVQARNDMGYGPLSQTTIFRTPRFDGTDGGMIETPDDYGRGSLERPHSKNNWMMQTPYPDKEAMDAGNGASGLPLSYLWIIIGCLGGTVLIIFFVIVAACFFCRQSRTNSDSSSMQKGVVMPSKMAKSELSDLKPPDLWIHGNIEMSELEQASDVEGSTVGRHGARGHERNVTGNLEDERYQNLSMRPLPAIMPLDASHGQKELTSTSSDFKYHNSSNQPSRHNSLSSRAHFPHTPRVNVADIAHTNSARAMKPFLNSSSSKATSPATQPLISPPPLCLSSKLSEFTQCWRDPEEREVWNYNGSDELTEEMANIEGLMKDLSDITRQQFAY